MAAASREARPRPAIQPIRTTGPGHSYQAVRARMAFKSPAWLATPLSPLSRPSPVYPDSEDERMKEHDKAAVERLEPRSRKPSICEAGLQSAKLRPISQQALPTPLTLDARTPPLSAPLLPPPNFRRSAIAEESRIISLRDPEVERIGSSPRAYERRGSAPPGAILARNMQLQRQRAHLRRRGFVGSYGGCEPDLLVMPVELRRLSTITTPSTDGGMPSPYPVNGRLTARVVIHSRNRKPVVLTRTFDLDELRATIPRPRQAPGVLSSRRASMATLQLPTPTNQPSSPALLAASREGRRHSSAGLYGLDSHRSPALERRGSVQGLTPVPMHLEYARAYLPVLAAIILSELIKSGDTLELPLPHPRAWEDTVTYVYTGRVELTEPIHRNILYLGGKV